MIKKYIQKIGLIASLSLVIGLGGGVLTASAAALPITPQTNTFAAIDCTKDGQAKACLYQKYLNPAIKLLSAVVGVLAVLMIIVGGVQYSSAGSDPQKITEARKKIINALLGLVAYIFLFAFLNWLVPGGLVN